VSYPMWPFMNGWKYVVHGVQKTVDGVVNAGPAKSHERIAGNRNLFTVLQILIFNLHFGF
jgi:hypothetical protein